MPRPALAIAALAAPALAATTAIAHAGERCVDGVEHARRGDLPRAALYLEGCEGGDARRVAADVARKLRGGELSALAIVTTPEGLSATTDALPGETFVTPATVWARAGTYTITIHAADRTLATTVTVDARSRASVIVDATTRAATPKHGTVDFREDTPEQTAHAGPPPAVKHGTMMPAKYLRRVDPTAPTLDDPFAARSDVARWRVGARVGAGVLDQDSAGLGFAVALRAVRPLAGPTLLAARLDYSHRALDTIAANAGLGVELWSTRRLALSAAASLRGEVRVQDTLAMQPVARAGLGAALDLDLALSQVSVSLRAEHGVTELVPGARTRAVLVELGYDWP